jgi:hypothetical protein
MATSILLDEEFFMGSRNDFIYTRVSYIFNLKIKFFNT